MKLYLTALMLCMSGSALSVTLYKHVKEDGSVVYTDVPVANSVAIDLSSSNSAVMPGITKPRNFQAKRTEKALPNYRLSLVSPAPGSTIRDNLGRMTVIADMTPKGPGQFQLFLDGELYATKGSPVFQLENVERGEHKIQIKYLHNSGRILASTPVELVYMHQASALIKAN